MRAVRCADSLFSRLDGCSGQSGQIQNAQNPARMIKKESSNLRRTPFFTHQRLPLDSLHSASCNWKQTRLTLFPPLRNEADAAFVSSPDPLRLHQHAVPVSSEPTKLLELFPKYLPIDSTAEFIPKYVGLHEENTFPIILFPDISSRTGGSIPQLPAGIELAKTSLRMFLEEGLDPLQSVFNLHIPDSPALLDPCGKTELGRTRGRSLRPRKDTKADGFFSCGSSVRIADTHA